MSQWLVTFYTRNDKCICTCSISAASIYEALSRASLQLPVRKQVVGHWTIRLVQTAQQNKKAIA